MNKTYLAPKEKHIKIYKILITVKNNLLMDNNCRIQFFLSPLKYKPHKPLQLLYNHKALNKVDVYSVMHSLGHNHISANEIYLTKTFDKQSHDSQLETCLIERLFIGI